MLTFSGSLKIFIAGEPCDMRNHSECPIIPSERGKPVESCDSSDFRGLVVGIIRVPGETPTAGP